MKSKMRIYVVRVSIDKEFYYIRDVPYADDDVNSISGNLEGAKRFTYSGALAAMVDSNMEGTFNIMPIAIGYDLQSLIDEAKAL